jgi:hypothetical protein
MTKQVNLTAARRAALVKVAEAADKDLKWAYIIANLPIDGAAYSPELDDYLAAFDPPTVLALLRDLAAAEGRGDNLTGTIDWIRTRTHADEGESTEHAVERTIGALQARLDAPIMASEWDALVHHSEAPAAKLAAAEARVERAEQNHEMWKTTARAIERERDAARMDLSDMTGLHDQAHRALRNVTTENAHLRARVAAANALAKVLAKLIAGGWTSHWPMTAEAQLALEAFDATATDEPK